MDIVGDFMKPGWYVGVSYAEGELMLGVAWYFGRRRKHVTLHLPFVHVDVKHESEDVCRCQEAES